MKVTEETTVGELLAAVRKEGGAFQLHTATDAGDAGEVFTLLVGSGDFAHRFRQTGEMLAGEQQRLGAKPLAHTAFELAAPAPKRKASARKKS